LSAAGILALVPDYFQKNPRVAHDSSAAVFLQIPRRHREWEIVLRDAVSTAKALPGVDAARVGLLGFSLGGFLCLRIRDSVDVLVEYFAPYRFPSSENLGVEASVMGLGPGPNPRLKAHIHHGYADALVPLNLNAEPIRAALEAENATVSTSYFNGANHGFAGDDAANTHARDTSFDETTQFFKTYL
jgi:dienelactone hydrolase